ncbi:LysR family transcriptional regulator [Phenylobacterium sp. J426]|uniref:LysR family transcriptional regulator n=1 Tax=Phenylobacterium sp. J426 TaxID=2898439 RepID=UPI002151C5B8|nr:LysR family transcriptional regulator [Phenylobacterium sp. J426]MCR5873737.1 LysR family transcriptional regulator [Phenylobacterium sp. J426]
MAKDFEVRHCRALLALDEKGGVGAAARALGVAQSTLSEALLSLERLLGFAVTVRRPGCEATLTPAALRLLPHARALVAASEAAMASAQASKDAVIRLGAVESVSSHLLPGPLDAFSRRSPHVDVRVASGVCADLLGRVEQRQLDAALTLEVPRRLEQPGAQELARIRLRFVVPADDPLGDALDGRPVRRAELSDRTFLLADPEGAFSDVLKRWLGGDHTLRMASAGSTDGVKRGGRQAGRDRSAARLHGERGARVRGAGGTGVRGGASDGLAEPRHFRQSAGGVGPRRARGDHPRRGRGGLRRGDSRRRGRSTLPETAASAIRLVREGEMRRRNCE